MNPKIPGAVLQWLDRVQPSATIVLSVAAVALGLASAAGIWVFKRLIDLFHAAAFDGLGAGLAGLGPWSIALVPLIGGLLVGLLVRAAIGAERHHGVAGIMESVALAGGRLRYQRMPAKTLAAALSIGAGASVGPEDPSVQIGANLGSLAGQWLRLSDERVRTLVAAGAASGIAAAFNAPIAGVFFALEIILGELGAGALGTIVLAAVASAVLTQALSGPQPAFVVPAYTIHSVWELPLYVGLGVLAGPVAAAYVRALFVAQDAFHALPIPRWTSPALAGLLVGVAGVFFPQVFGVGYETIGGLLTGAPFSVQLLLTLLLLKLALTAISLGGDFRGGTFAPALFLGAMLGGAYGFVAQSLFPQLSIAPQAYAMVGMAAVLAGAVHAPLTAVILLFEMTNDYRIILPVMGAVVVSLFVSQYIQRDSVYVHGLLRKGIRLQRGRDVEVLETLTVGEIMQPVQYALRADDTLAQAAEVFAATRRHGLCVVNEIGELAGIMTVQDLDRAQAETPDPHRRTVWDVCTRNLLVAYPDETIGLALQRISARDLGRLPVVARDDPRRLLGMLRRNDVVRAYNIALARRTARRHQAQAVRLDATTGAHVEELSIALGAPCDGRRIREVAWPHDCVVASVRRGREVILPHGDTLLQAGDTLVIVAEEPARETLHTLCAGG
jgi:CIC family chloride channel protein